MTRRAAMAVAALALLAAACSGAGPLAVVDGVELTLADLDGIHPDVDALSNDELASSVLLLVLDEAFTARAAADFGITPDPTAIESAFAGRTARYEGRGDLDELLAQQNLRAQRLRIESSLDALRDAIGEHLVRNEGPGFDLDQAYIDYVLAEGEVCVRHIQIAELSDYETALDRLAAGEPFDEVALDLSVDPFVSRDDGGTGAGGDLGCSLPGSLPPGLDTAVLDAPLGEPTGPIVSSIGAHLVVVYERSVPELLDVRAEVIEAAIAIQGEEVFRVWAVDVLQSLDVTVDPAFGTWGVLPETDPVPTVVTPGRTDRIVGG